MTLSDGTVVVLERPVSRGDSLASALGSPPVVALSDIRLVEVRNFSVARTVVLAIGIAVVAGSWTALARGVQGGTSTPAPPLPKE